MLSIINVVQLFEQNNNRGGYNVGISSTSESSAETNQYRMVRRMFFGSFSRLCC